MRAMDYISSTNICYLICDILKTLDAEPVEHGMRVAYMLMKLLECKGGYDEYEAAEYVFLAMLHDIGAYRREPSSARVEYDSSEAAGKRHAVYGGLFLKETSPFGARCDIVLYHHLRYAALSKLNYEHSRIAMYLNMLEEVDLLYCRDGLEMDYRSFEDGAGEQYYPEAVLLLLKCIRHDKMLEKLASGEYRQELKKYMEYVLFTNEEKENYLKFAMHCIGLQNKTKTAAAIIRSCIADEIAEEMELSGREREKLEYAAMLRDVDNAILKKYFAVQEIPQAAAKGTQRMPEETGELAQENRSVQLQRIIQVADYIVSMVIKEQGEGRKLDKKLIVDELQKLGQRRNLDEAAAMGAARRFDIIEKRVQTETRNYLALHVGINKRYKILLEGTLGEYNS